MRREGTKNTKQDTKKKELCCLESAEFLTAPAGRPGIGREDGVIRSPIPGLPAGAMNEEAERFGIFFVSFVPWCRILPGR
jgi:hypothetical protein